MSTSNTNTKIDSLCDNLEGCKLDGTAETKISDEELFKQPPPLYEDCPICFERMPILPTGSNHYACCGKIICSGCIHAPLYDDQGNEVDNEKCPFCRTPLPETDEEVVNRIKKRVEAGDATAMYNTGNYCRDGRNGFPVDHTKALELYHRAGELGYSKAYTSIGYAYNNGIGVEADKKKAIYYFELAAMMGDIMARSNLGILEEKIGNFDRALKHYMIAIRGGYSKSLKLIQALFSNGHATKDDYTAALRFYQQYLGEIKSRQRDDAAAFDEEFRYY